ncbi:MAG TPA: hypothetical protein VGE96_04320, partial [Steroidobacteraceae bacterium]
MKALAIRASTCSLVVLLAVSLAACSASPPKAPPAPPAAASTRDAVAESERAWTELMRLEAAKRGAEARALVLKQLDASDFGTLPGSLRHRWLQRAGMMNIGAEAYEEGLSIFRYTSGMAEADQDDWRFRFICAQMTQQQAESVHSLTYLVRKWPEVLPHLDNQMVGRTALKPAASPQDEADRFPLLEAL